MSFAPAPILETDRLILRAPIAEDFEAYAAWAADEEVMRHIGGAQSRPVAWRGLCSVVGAWQIRGFSMFSLLEKSTGRWVGRLGPWQPEGWPGSEVGWALNRDCWGKGYAREGAAACMDYVFDVLGWAEAIHTIEPENTASQAVAKALGSTLKGPAKMPPPYEDSKAEIWSQTRDAWIGRRGR
ncbi:GNAT family N-acetyltransferase [Phenylobacterium sp.]|uniref:GNAT family N-acetyltransferase n=1 Tax=Phenylobacterium sp. TaxID=1871053 RepID=UPI00121CA92B|nr:GNAT family N-acetyltransferase [Phenylobacterium sp.]THD57746.1 MAG: N-acetyltransferase [Phenylobacterium sp.]